MGMFGVAALSIIGMRSLSVLDEVSQGYEGSKSWFEGIDMQRDGRYGTPRITYRLNDQNYPAPQPDAPGFGSTGMDVPTWDFGRGSFNLDPKGPSTAMHNLVGITRTNGEFEKLPRSDTPLTKTVTWTKVLETYPNGTKKVKTVTAQAYFFLTQIEFKPKADETFGWGGVLLTSEKDGYWSDFKVVMVAHVNAWDPLGNATSWARILGVEVADVKIEYGSDKGRDAAKVEASFFQSQMLPLYRTFEAAVGQSGGITPVRGDLKVEQVKGQDIDPSGGDLVTTGYVTLPFASFGLKAGYWDAWTPPQLIVTLRTHVLKVDEWIALQQVGSTFTPSPNVGAGFKGQSSLVWWDDLFKGIGKWLDNPFNLVGLVVVVIVIVVIIGVIVLAPFLLKGYLAYRVLRILNTCVAVERWKV